MKAEDGIVDACGDRREPWVGLLVRKFFRGRLCKLNKDLIVLFTILTITILILLILDALSRKSESLLWQSLAGLLPPLINHHDIPDLN